MFAAVSHLPHVLAYALVHDVAKRNNSRAAVLLRRRRLPRLHAHRLQPPEMWRDICLANRDACCSELKLYANELGAIASCSTRATARALEKLFAARARETRLRQDWIRIELKPRARAAPRARCGCRARRASPTASCCSPRWRTARPRSRDLLDADDTRVMLDALRALGVSFVRQRRITGSGRSVPGTQGRAFSRQCRHRVPAADRGAGVLRRRVPPVGRAAHARAADRRPGRRAARHRRAHRLRGQGGLSAAARSIRARSERRRTLQVRGDVSSQFLTALLMALPLSGKAGAHRGAGRADLQALRRDHAERDAALRRRGAAHRLALFRRAGRRLSPPGKIHVEGDASSASYFLAAGAIGGGPVRVEGVGRDSIQGDVRFTEVLERMGAQVTLGDDWIEASRTRRSCKADRHGPQPHSRCRDDRRGAGAVRRRARARCATSPAGA